MVEKATLPVVGPRACAIAFCAFMLGGCLDTAVDLGARQASAQQATRRFAARPGVSPHGASLGFASIEGPPDAVGARFMQRFTQTAQARDVALVPAETAQYRLRAYLTASPAQGATRTRLCSRCVRPPGPARAASDRRGRRGARRRSLGGRRREIARALRRSRRRRGRRLSLQYARGDRRGGRRRGRIGGGRATSTSSGSPAPGRRGADALA